MMQDIIETCRLCNGVSGVYLIRNVSNGKIYVGRSESVGHRVAGHFYILRNQTHYNRTLQEDFNLYGESCFEFEIIAEAEEFALKSLEESFLKSSDKSKLYNRHISGNTGATSKDITSDAKLKMSKNRSGNKNHFYGKKHSAETIERMRESARKRKRK